MQGTQSPPWPTLKGRKGFTGPSPVSACLLGLFSDLSIFSYVQVTATWPLSPNLLQEDSGCYISINGPFWFMLLLCRD
jgi:hypothetical protein